MKLSLDSYKTFTLALIIKRCRANGVWYKDESINELLNNLGLRVSYVTFKKYLSELVRLGCFNDKNQLKDKYTIAKNLGIKVSNERGKYFLNQFLREEPFEEWTFSKSVDFVIKSLIIFDLRYQNWKVLKNNYLRECAQKVLSNQSVFNGRDYRMIQAVVKIAKKNGVSTDETAWSMVNTESDYIKTGSHFLGKKLGLTHEKVNNLLNEMNEDRLLQRIIQTQDFIVHGDMDERAILEYVQGKKYFGYNGYYRMILGSKIILPQKLRRTIKELKIKKLDTESILKPKVKWSVGSKYKLSKKQELILN